jgi:hypothetical protein
VEVSVGKHYLVKMCLFDFTFNIEPRQEPETPQPKHHSLVLLAAVTATHATTTAPTRTVQAHITPIQIIQPMPIGVPNRSSRHVILTTNGARTSSTLKAGLASKDPTLFLVNVFGHADGGVVNATTCTLVDCVMHALGEVFGEGWRIAVDAGHVLS